jgi:membrane protease YdiL (CAAX protease family)
MSTASLDESRKRIPIAPWWHTLLITVILLGIAVGGAMFQTSRIQVTQSVHNVFPLYMSVLVSELVLLYAVWRGIRQTGTTLGGLVGRNWRTPGDVLRDVLLAIGFWAVVIAASGAWDRLSPVAGPLHSINPLLPRGVGESVTWILLSIVAGIVEEIVFRGYFLRQFEALTQTQWAAVTLQAVLFGVTHGYQGLAACIKITLIGVMFGVLAVWRKSLRPGIIAHAWTDIASGVLGI